MVAGADITIYPTYGLNFPISRLDCTQIASACTESWEPLLPIFPTAAGRMGEDRIREMCEVYGRDCVFILGSQIRGNHRKASLHPVSVSCRISLSFPLLIEAG